MEKLVYRRIEVHDQRLQAGLTDPPPILTPRHSPNLDAAANEKRGSYRFLSTSDKRSRPDYTGLDGAPTKKKRRRKDKTKGGHGANDNTQKEKEAVVTQEGGSSPATLDEVKTIQSFVDEIIQLDYSDAIQAIKQENAFSASKNIQTRYNETAYWEIIEKGADLLDPKSLPTPKGPLDEFTIAEKVATERFMREAGYGLSLANQRQCRLFWKRLCQMRKMGVDKILLYRTKEFDRFCKTYPSEDGASLVQMVRLWEDMYGLQIKQLESRVIQESMGDLTGRLWPSEPKRLRISHVAWDGSSNQCLSDEEAITFQSRGQRG
ncbi:uncharacterized protein N7473_004440 [Penicillium subrubescens]|uniref:uncharacterized protein n=1 Tax=Penicillium subrubescens TaxID=1316194 RepID=UPI0025459BBA|nr:uncharacterized protein N7473_004440 [Penicillium subrubescens]KAJ5900370.1 hypothetical protein N7473_004440 [Penicillium subrubescens]